MPKTIADTLTRESLFAELRNAGFTPPADTSTDALFDCVDCLRRKQRHEGAGVSTPPALFVIHTEKGARQFRGAPPRPAPPLDVWEGNAPEILRAVLSFA